jgi:glycoprotein endo-alpha-1,2-mannosidase
VDFVRRWAVREAPADVPRRPARDRRDGRRQRGVVSLGTLVLAVVLTAVPATMEPWAAAAAPPAMPPAPAAATVAADLPPVVGPAPSPRIAAFYYPWYGGTMHWADGESGASLAADDINSDYYPALGTYDSMDPAVVARHMAWLRGAGVGVIVTSWWGQGSREDLAVPLLLDTAARYGIKVAFHMEDYPERSAARLAQDVGYLYRQYGSTAAFFRMAARTPYGGRSEGQGLFFLWSPGVAGRDGRAVTPAYWKSGIDAIHASAEGGLVVASTTDTAWIAGAHLDGLYDYVAADSRFEWARSLPPGALYVPSVAPGFSARRIGYPLSTDFPRDAGATFNAQWKAAMGTGVEPALVTITSFNEWHEGTQIEPAAPDHAALTGRRYLSYAPLAPDGYLAQTRTWATRFAATRWPASVGTRIRIRTTSDWTTVRVTGALVTKPKRASLTGRATDAAFDGVRFTLTQPLAAAKARAAASMTWEVQLVGVTRASSITIRIERGDLGATTVTLSNVLGPKPVAVASISWAGRTGGRNPKAVTWPARLLVDPTPRRSGGGCGRR